MKKEKEKLFKLLSKIIYIITFILGLILFFIFFYNIKSMEIYISYIYCITMLFMILTISFLFKEMLGAAIDLGRKRERNEKNKDVN